MYKKGDIIKIRSDLEVGKDYGGLLFVSKMLPKLGTKVKIISCGYSSKRQPRFAVENCTTWFSIEMFESVKPKLFKLL